MVILMGIKVDILTVMHTVSLMATRMVTHKGLVHHNHPMNQDIQQANKMLYRLFKIGLLIQGVNKL